MHGFKSFVKKTEVPFTTGINVILGPNGSGKSNLSDALCFVLGRLSAKSMRAAKAKNLIFLGTKAAAPAKEASVELVFDNSNKTFSIEKSEVYNVYIQGQNVIRSIDRLLHPQREIYDNHVDYNHGYDDIIIEGNQETVDQFSSSDQALSVEDTIC